MSGGPAETKVPIISLGNVRVSYLLKNGSMRRQRYYPLEDVSFDLFEGDSLGVVGRNGCGKSTLLRLLAGVMAPDEGVLRTRKNLRTSLLSLQLGFASHLSGRENAILSGMFLGMTLREIEACMDAIIDFAEIGAFIDQPLLTYSSGMRARLGFAVAFQLKPDVLLVDEVTGVGDLAFREKSYRAMKERLSSSDSTIVFVSHQASQVRSLCSRAIWLDAGRIRAAGTPDEVLTQYESFVAPVQPDPHEGSRQAIRALLECVELAAGAHAPEPRHIWIEKECTLRFTRPVAEITISVAPPAAAIRIHEHINLTIENRRTGEQFSHEFTSAAAFTFAAHLMEAGDELRFNASNDYCPADHGGSDPRRLALIIYDPVISR